MTLNIDALLSRIATHDAPILEKPAPAPQDYAKPVTFIFSGGKRDAETMEAARDLLQWFMDKEAHALTRVKVRLVAGADVHNNGPRFVGNPGPSVRRAAARAFDYALSELGTVRTRQTEAPRNRRHVPGSALPIPGTSGNKLDGSRIVVRSTLRKF